MLKFSVKSNHKEVLDRLSFLPIDIVSQMAKSASEVKEAMEEFLDDDQYSEVDLSIDAEGSFEILGTSYSTRNEFGIGQQASDIINNNINNIKLGDKYGS